MSGGPGFNAHGTVAVLQIEKLIGKRESNGAGYAQTMGTERCRAEGHQSIKGHKRRGEWFCSRSLDDEFIWLTAKNTGHRNLPSRVEPSDGDAGHAHFSVNQDAGVTQRPAGEFNREPTWIGVKVKNPAIAGPLETLNDTADLHAKAIFGAAEKTR